MFCQKNVLAKVAFARAISVARNRNDFVGDCRQKCTRHVSSGGAAGIRIPNCYRYPRSRGESTIVCRRRRFGRRQRRCKRSLTIGGMLIFIFFRWFDSWRERSPGITCKFRVWSWHDRNPPKSKSLSRLEIFYSHLTPVISCLSIVNTVLPTH
jgi:hypothetical protein